MQHCLHAWLQLQLCRTKVDRLYQHAFQSGHAAHLVSAVQSAFRGDCLVQLEGRVHPMARLAQVKADRAAVRDVYLLQSECVKMTFREGEQARVLGQDGLAGHGRRPPIQASLLEGLGIPLRPFHALPRVLHRHLVL
jgi:hypothetical protein